MFDGMRVNLCSPLLARGGRVYLGQLDHANVLVPFLGSGKRYRHPVTKIVLDPGHGGRDQGTAGSRLLEKAVTLNLSNRVAKILRAYGYKVELTRTRDTALSLDERSAYANRTGADLFISIHANASSDRTVRGIETFCMLSLINRMLEISKTESGASSLLKTEFDLVALVNRSAELFRMVTGQKRQTLEVAVPADPVRLFADQGKIRQLLANLLDNASKFTSPGGTIRVEVSGRPDAVILAVSDTGCGISPEDREHVFKRFYRADSSRNLPGNGLGLSMVQAVAHAHGGRVELVSEPGKGSCFTVVFPRNPESADA